MKREGFAPGVILAFAAATLATLLLCVCAGSVAVPLRETLRVLTRALLRQSLPESAAARILLASRLPRVLCVALTGASLALCGAAMQGLLKNPLADGSTLGVSSGASLGAVTAIAFRITLPSLPMAGTTAMAILFAFLSLMIILLLAWRLDRSFSTGTIILVGVIFSMFVSSLMTLLITFASDRIKTITFWTMGSLAGSSYRNAAMLLAVLIGVCVSIGGTIAFVGLVTPHMVRLLTGPNHRRLLPASLFGGATFLMLCDLAARTVLRPVELPVGVVTSLLGAALFVVILCRTRRGAP